MIIIWGPLHHFNIQGDSRNNPRWVKYQVAPVMPAANTMDGASFTFGRPWKQMGIHFKIGFKVPIQSQQLKL